jgi:hypothetical protein
MNINIKDVFSMKPKNLKSSIQNMKSLSAKKNKAQKTREQDLKELIKTCNDNISLGFLIDSLEKYSQQLTPNENNKPEKTPKKKTNIFGFKRGKQRGGYQTEYVHHPLTHMQNNPRILSRERRLIEQFDIELHIIMMIQKVIRILSYRFYMTKYEKVSTKNLKFIFYEIVLNFAFFILLFNGMESKLTYYLFDQFGTFIMLFLYMKWCESNSKELNINYASLIIMCPYYVLIQ